MSRAFVREDGGDREPDYRLPEPSSAYFDEAAAWALITGADEGDTLGAERATGCRWGEPRLVPIVRAILDDAESSGNDRVAQLSRRFLKVAAGR